MFGQVAPTPFDLRFVVLGFPVRVHPTFWLGAALIGWRPDEPVTVLLLWILCVFFSILVHELGHALMARRFGGESEIVLYFMGGYATVPARARNRTWPEVLILAAGPGAGFVLYLAAWTVLRLIVNNRMQVAQGVLIALSFLILINLWWGILNLLPIFPLDGGQISRALFLRFRRRDGIRLSLMVSFVVAAAGAGYFYFEKQNYNAFFFGLFAIGSLQALQGETRA